MEEHGMGTYPGYVNRVVQESREKTTNEEIGVEEYDGVVNAD